ncbi:MAG: beta strand repeat-containing protein [Granulosicoccus sp.]
MMWKRFPRSPVAKAIALSALASVASTFVSTAYAATPAGTQIRNLATVTYEDAAGNTYSANSAEAVVTVAQVYSATLGVDVNVNAVANQIVYLPYILTNTGNGTDTFDLTAVNGITGGDSIDSASITIYHDQNGDGQPTGSEPVVSSLSLPANVNNSANLVVAVVVPNTATDAQTLGVTLTARAQEGTGSGVVGSVDDLSATQGLDGLNDTNESLITVTGDAVLVTNKTFSHDAANNRITYTVEVRNNGNRPANDVVLFDGLPANTTYVSHSLTGLLASNGDTVLDPRAELGDGGLSETVLGIDLNADGDLTDTNETTLGLDLNTDGNTTSGAVEGIYAVDNELPVNTTVSLSFTVQYDPNVLGGGYVIENTGYASGDTNEDSTPDSLVPSNTTQTTINSTYGVTITDSGINASPGVNDGGDDDGDGAANDQFVDEVAAGAEVIFTNVITNTGNTDDIFELTVDSGNFPSGTTFTLFDASGSVLLGNANASGTDSGVMAANEVRTIIVKALLPAGASGDAPLPDTEYQATVTATSAASPSVSATVDNSLGTIIAASADIHGTDNGTVGANEDPLAGTPYGVITTVSGALGTTVNIPLYIDNESGSGSAFQLAAGSSFDGTTLGALPPGWTVEFFDVDINGDPTGPAITSTGTSVLAANSVDNEIVAQVFIPNNAALAVADVAYDTNGDGSIDADDDTDGNSDGDGDYPIFFQITSSSTGATDIILDAVDVDAQRAVALVTNSTGQIEQGGRQDYTHTLSNTGNISEVLELESANSQPGWTNSVSIDTDGDGIGDTNLASLTPGTISVQQADTTVISVVVTDADTDGNPELAVQPGYSIPLFASVFAPNNAPLNSVDVLTISATNTDADVNAPDASVTDQTSLINGQVDIVKTVAVDTDCDGTADSAFLQTQSTTVEPTQCAIWQIRVENTGSADAYEVVISDEVTDYSTYQTGSLRYCVTNGCTPATVTDAVDAGDAGALIGNNVFFYVGTGADPLTATGGTLIPGQSATAQFRVQVD